MSYNVRYTDKVTHKLNVNQTNIFQEIYNLIVFYREYFFNTDVRPLPILEVSLVNIKGQLIFRSPILAFKLRESYLRMSFIPPSRYLKGRIYYVTTTSV